MAWILSLFESPAKLVPQNYESVAPMERQAADRACSDSMLRSIVQLTPADGKRVHKCFSIRLHP